MNSLNEGLYFGVPLVVVPQQIEQTINARQAAKVGAAIVLGDRPPYGRIHADELHHALTQVLGDARYKHAAEAVGDSFRQAGGYRRAADIVEIALEPPDKMVLVHQL